MNKFFNFNELEKYGKKTIDLIIKNHKNYRDRPVYPKDTYPGFLRNKINWSVPKNGSNFDDILDITEKHILPNILAWQHPRFFGYFQSITSHPVIMGEMIKAAVNTVGFQWASSPASTELENIICDWTCEMLNLPKKFFLNNTGGGCISISIGDALLLSIQMAKYKKMKELGLWFGDTKISNFVAYISDYSFIAYYRHFFIKEIKHVRKIPSILKDNKISLDLENFYKTYEEDVKNGLIPFFYGGTIVSTCTNSSDPVDLLGKFCREKGIHYNVDAAYSSTFMCIPEIRERYDLENINSICINLSKAGLCGLGSSQFYVDDKHMFVESISGKNDSNLIALPEYLNNEVTTNDDVVDYTNWQTGWGRRFEALKIFFVYQRFGTEGFQEYINHIIKLSDYVVQKVKNSNFFILFVEKYYALVCIQIIKTPSKEFKDQEERNSYTRNLIKRLNVDGLIFITGGSHSGKVYIRFNVGSYDTTREDIDQSFDYIVKLISK
jgi:aromatic-L-amino-acid decarboxylase